MRTVAHLSDLHFGRHEPAIADAIVAKLGEVGPDLTVISGDLTQRARRREFAAARDFVGRLRPPVLIVPGNHDVPLYDVARRFWRPLARYRRYICDDLQPLFVDQQIAVLGINTARSATFSNGRISYAQAAAIRATFSQLPDDRFRILVAHHPLMAPPGRPGLAVVGRAATAIAAAAAAGVQLVLAGHHHHAFMADLAGFHLAMDRSILIVEAGTAMSLRRRGEPNSFNLIEIAPERLSCTVQVWGGDRFIGGEAAAYSLADRRWTPLPQP
jgi:3',5'-cyclic AMP phosphodiesterase CpdA